MTDKSGTMLYLDGVSVSFDGFRALNHLSIIVHPQEMLAIIGPNGAGKTTMMDIITGKTRPDEGDVFFDGRTDQRTGGREQQPQRHGVQRLSAHGASRSRRRNVRRPRGLPAAAGPPR